MTAKKCLLYAKDKFNAVSDAWSHSVFFYLILVILQMIMRTKVSLLKQKNSLKTFKNLALFI